MAYPDVARASVSRYDSITVTSQLIIALLSRYLGNLTHAARTLGQPVNLSLAAGCSTGVAKRCTIEQNKMLIDNKIL